MDWLTDIITIFCSTIQDVLPIVVIIFAFQMFVIRRTVPNLKRVIIGFIYVVCGLSLFLLGLERALFPLGAVMAKQLTSPEFLLAHGAHDLGATLLDWQDYYWVYLFGAALGFATTIAEPSLIAVAMKAEQISGGTIHVMGLRIAVAIGVAFGISLGCYRIVVGDPIHYYIIVGYLVVMVQTLFAPKVIIPLAYDSGGVTTSTVTVPLVTALGLGLAQTVPGRSPLIDGFGLIAFASLFPMISVMGYAQISELWTKFRERS